MEEAPALPTGIALYLPPALLVPSEPNEGSLFYHRPPQQQELADGAIQADKVSDESHNPFGLTWPEGGAATRVASSTPLLVAPSCAVLAHVDNSCPRAAPHNRHSLAFLDALARSYDPIFLRDGRGSDIPFDPTAFSEHVRKLQFEFRKSAIFDNAEAAAAGFEWPPTALTADRDALLRLGSVAAVIANKHNKRREAGFNIDRVNTLYSDDPAFGLLQDLAVTGAVIDIDPDFRNIPSAAQERAITTTIPKTIGVHTMNLIDKGRGVLLPLDSIPEADLTALSFCGLHLVGKADDPLGRFCLDPTNAPSGYVALNSDIAKQRSIARYGKVTHPEIGAIVRRWCAWRIQHGMQWCDMWCYKEDVKSAFPQVNMNAHSAMLLACLVAVGLVLIFTVGAFGWCGMPMGFEVIMAAVMRAIVKLVHGPCDRYCDDVFGCGDKTSASADAHVVRTQILRTFGEGSVALDKSWLDQHAVILGWHIDFRTNSVRPSDRGIRKIAYAFFSFDIQARLPLKKWQELHSLAERYSNGLLATSDLVQPLAGMLKGWSTTRNTQRLQLKRANSAARFAIEMWRVFSIRLWQNCSAYSMSLEQFSGFYDPTCLSPRIAVSDSSTPRVAVAIYDQEPDGSRKLVAWTGYNYPKFGYSELYPATKFQCQREYLGLLLALLLNCAISSPSEQASQHLTWVNDNTGALVWAQKGRVSCASGQAACMAVSWFQVSANLHFHQTLFLPGSEMGDIDSESRIHEVGKSSPSLIPEKYVHLQQILDDSGVMHACDPSLVHSAVQDHHTAFKLMHARLNGLVVKLNKYQQQRG